MTDQEMSELDRLLGQAFMVAEKLSSSHARAASTHTDNLARRHEALQEQVAALQQENECMRATLADPPPDVQEAVICKLGLVSKDLLRELAEVCAKGVAMWDAQDGQLTTAYHPYGDNWMRTLKAALARAEEVLK